MKILFLVAATFLGSATCAWSSPPSPEPVASTGSFVAAVVSTPSPEAASSTDTYDIEGESAPTSPEPAWIEDEYFTEDESAPPSLDAALVTGEYFTSGESEVSPVSIELGNLPEVPVAANMPQPDDIICRKYRPVGTHMIREFCVTFAEIEAHRIEMQKRYREMGFH